MSSPLTLFLIVQCSYFCMHAGFGQLETHFHLIALKDINFPFISGTFKHISNIKMFLK